MLATLYFCPSGGQLYAQLAHDCHFSVRGFVRGQQEKTPVAGASIYIRELRTGVISDTNGEYVISGLCTGYYTLVCQHVAYHTDSIRIHVHEEPVQLNFALKEADIQLEAVVVTGEKALPISTQPAAVLKGAELDQSRGQSLGGMLKNLPGISTLQTGPAIAKPVIHGLHSNRVLILNNGIRQEGQQWGSEHAPEIDPFIATKLTVIKGAAAVRYGADAIGGVIIAEPPPLPIHSGTTGEVNLIGFTNGRGGISSALVQGGFKNAEGWGWRLQGTGRLAGDFRAPGYMLSNTGVRELNFSGALAMNKTRYGADIYFSRFHTRMGILRSAHIGSITDREEALRRGQPFYINDFTYRINAPNQSIAHHLLKASAFLNSPGLGTLRLQYGGQLDERQEYDLRRAGRSGKPALNLQLFTHTLDLVLEHKPVRNFSGSAGLSGMYQDNTNIPGTGVTPFVPNYTAWTAGVFGIEKWTRGKWELEAGARYDYRFQQAQRFDRNKQLVKPELSFHNLLGTAGAAFRPGTHWILKTNLGTAWRPPNIAELYSQGLHHGSATFEVGNDSLQTERAIKWVNTASFTNARLAVEATLYVNQIRNYIYLRPGMTIEQSVRGAFLVFNYTQTDAQFVGTDVSLAYKLTRELTFRSKISAVRARDTRRNHYLIYVPADRFDNSITWNQEKLGRLTSLYLTLGTVNVRRQNRVPEGEDYMPAPDSYMLLNVQTGITVPLAEHPLAISLSVENLLDTAYRDYMNRLRYYADEAGRNITLRLKYQFGKRENI